LEADAVTYELAYLAHLSLHPCKPGSRKDAVPMVPDNTDRLLAYIAATRRREPNTMDWERVRRK
jgi:hypothetical protein